MGNDLALVLLIALIGMAAVVIVIILVSVLMSVLVRLTSKPEAQLPPPVLPDQDDVKIRAAVAAVAVARLRESTLAPLRFPLPPKALVSAWQAVLRSNILNKRGSIR